MSAGNGIEYLRFSETPIQQDGRRKGSGSMIDAGLPINALTKLERIPPVGILVRRFSAHRNTLLGQPQRSAQLGPFPFADFREALERQLRQILDFLCHFSPP
jgi:hypothetical protein